MATRMTARVLGHELVFEFADPYGAALQRVINNRSKLKTPTAIHGYPVSVDGNEPHLGEGVTVLLWSVDDTSFVSFRDDDLDGLAAEDSELQVLDRVDHWEKIGIVPFEEDGTL